MPEARFCRLCGAPLKAGGGDASDAPVSPLAQTVPLTGEGRATDGLSADDSRRTGSDTSKVGRAEMENLLRRAQARQSNDDGVKLAAAAPAASPVSQQTTTLPSDAARSEPPPDSTVAPKAASTPKDTQEVHPNVRSRRLWQVAAVALLCVALVAGVLAFVLSRRTNSTDNANTSPISISDQKQLVAGKLAEAEALLTKGEFDPAINVLRAALKLDPANVEAHMRLGNALERTGARQEAIKEYEAAAASDPGNVSAWRSLASAQFEEQLYNEAVESYRRLLAASGNNVDDETWLAYGDALRLAGRKDEARAAYQKIGASASAAVAQEARRHLTELGPPPVTVNTERTSEERAGQGRESEATTPSPTPQPSVTQTPAATSTATQVDYDAYYFQAVNIVNGRDPKKIERAELLRALALFQQAALGGTHRAEAQRAADRLGKEYDRRRKL
ncbi:MAG TPA: tetratricopeptide repeat protein [Pyrinomonadaceae bacterium]